MAESKGRESRRGLELEDDLISTVAERVTKALTPRIIQLVNESIKNARRPTSSLVSGSETPDRNNSRCSTARRSRCPTSCLTPPPEGQLNDLPLGPRSSVSMQRSMARTPNVACVTPRPDLSRASLKPQSWQEQLKAPNLTLPMCNPKKMPCGPINISPYETMASTTHMDYCNPSTMPARVQQPGVIHKLQSLPEIKEKTALEALTSQRAAFVDHMRINNQAVRRVGDGQRLTIDTPPGPRVSWPLPGGIQGPPGLTSCTAPGLPLPPWRGGPPTPQPAPRQPPPPVQANHSAPIAARPSPPFARQGPSALPVLTSEMQLRF